MDSYRRDDRCMDGVCVSDPVGWPARVHSLWLYLLRSIVLLLERGRFGWDTKLLDRCTYCFQFFQIAII